MKSFLMAIILLGVGNANARGDDLSGIENIKRFIETKIAENQDVDVQENGGNVELEAVLEEEPELEDSMEIDEVNIMDGNNPLITSERVPDVNAEENVGTVELEAVLEKEPELEDSMEIPDVNIMDENNPPLTLRRADCKNTKNAATCFYWKKRYGCSHSYVKPRCQKTCGKCGTVIADGPFGGPGGSSFTDQAMHKHGDITAIDIRSGFLIDAIRVRYGNKWGDWHGGNGGTLHQFQLSPGSTIYHVQGRKGKERKVIEQLEFFADDGNTFGPLGGKGVCKKGWTSERPVCKLLYISGKAGKLLDSLKLHYKCN